MIAGHGRLPLGRGADGRLAANVYLGCAARARSGDRIWLSARARTVCCSARICRCSARDDLGRSWTPTDDAKHRILGNIAKASRWRQGTMVDATRSLAWSIRHRGCDPDEFVQAMDGTGSTRASSLPCRRCPLHDHRQWRHRRLCRAPRSAMFRAWQSATDLTDPLDQMQRCHVRLVGTADHSTDTHTRLPPWLRP